MPVIAELPRPNGDRGTRVETPENIRSYSVLLDAIPLPMIINTIDSSGGVTFDINHLMLNSLGYSEEEWQRNPNSLWSSILHPEDEQLVLSEYHVPIKTKEPRILEYRVLSKDRKVHWIKETTNLTENGLLETTLIDVTEEKERKTMIFIDELTGLPNGRAWNRAVEREEARFGHTDRPYSVLVVDANKFKEINDSFTHPVGDTVLICIGQFLRETIRRHDFDFVARPNGQGDEFYLLLPETDNAEAEKVLEYILEEAVAKLPQKLIEFVSQRHPAKEEKFKKFINFFTEEIIPLISIGHATKIAELNATQVIELADERMQAYKKSKKLDRDSISQG